MKGNCELFNQERQTLVQANSFANDKYNFKPQDCYKQINEGVPFGSVNFHTPAF